VTTVRIGAGMYGANSAIGAGILCTNPVTLPAGLSLVAVGGALGLVAFLAPGKCNYLFISNTSTLYLDVKTYDEGDLLKWVPFMSYRIAPNTSGFCCATGGVGRTACDAI